MDRTRLYVYKKIPKVQFIWIEETDEANVTNTATNQFLTLWRLHCAFCQGAAAMPKVPINAKGIVRDLENTAVHARTGLQLHVVWYMQMELIIWNLKAMNVTLTKLSPLIVTLAQLHTIL